MSLFKKEKRIESRPLPELPKIPRTLEFPSYEPQFPSLSETKETQEQVSFTKVGEYKPPEKELGLDLNLPIREKPMFKPVAPKTFTQEEKTLFIKIDRYREALESISLIRNKLKEADDVLKRIESIKTQEDKELQSWHDLLNRVKEKLIAINEKLFEV